MLIGMNGPYKPVVFGGTLAQDASKPSDPPVYAFNEYHGIAEFDIAPVNGYVITDLSAENSEPTSDVNPARPEVRHAIINLAADNHLGIWHSCANLVPVFSVQPGVINYIGEFSFNPNEDNWLSQDIGYDEDKAKSFIKANYPGLANLPLVTQHVMFMKNVIPDCGTMFLFTVPTVK